MSDTGAPWNLPYPESTDLVRDGAQAIEDLAEATATGLSEASGLVSTHYASRTASFSTTSTTMVNVPDVEVTFSPLDAANDVIIIVAIPMTRNSSAGNVSQFDVTENGTIIQNLWSVRSPNASDPFTSGVMLRINAGSTSPRTYRLRMSSNFATVTITNGANIIAMEVKV
jgi:hypothetical protein